MESPRLEAWRQRVLALQELMVLAQPASWARELERQAGVP
jgi:hypothetical protein